MLLAPAPFTFTDIFPSVPATISTLFASAGGFVPCNSEKVVFALLTLILLAPVPVSIPSESILIVAFFNPDGVEAVTVSPLYFVILGSSPTKSILILSFLYFSGIVLDVEVKKLPLSANL